MAPLKEEKGKKLCVVGNYRFTGKLLGKGNFARVEEAIHNILNVKVAIKIMDINQIKEEYVIRNLCREAKLMAKLNHPCICVLYQTMQRSDNVYYLVTELAPGGDLCSFVKEQRGGRLDERPARIYARQFVSALAHMHHIGVVHRDLKMENVMLNSAQTQIKIVDFGLSNFCNPNELLKTHCGSPEYAAPELFVTGMKYGPEVDLWSLGIILYGMVVGQLPFVSNRNEEVSSQERRKKLVAQINKGLSSAHKRSLSGFSADFRNMINRMLVPDVARRISIKEMMTHPFITEKGTKSIRINPLRKLEVQHQANIIAEICEMSRLPSDQVIRMVKQEPYSKIGGMFNILTHRMALNRLSGDGITKVPPRPEIDSKTKTTQELPIRKPFNLKSANSIRPPGGRGDDLYTPKIVVQDKKLSLQQNSGRPPTSPQGLSRPRTETKRPSTPISGTRPKTVQAKLSEQKVLHYRDVTMVPITRKSYSASITPKTNRPSTVASPIATKVSSTMTTKLAKGLVKRLCHPAVSTMESNQNKQGIKTCDPLNNKKSPPNGVRVKPKADTNRTEDRDNRAQTASVRKQRSKSEKLPNPRPCTTTSGAIRRSLDTTQSESKAATTNRPQTTPLKEYRPFSKVLKFARPPIFGQKLEKSAMAYGDIAIKNQKLKNPTIYDPIAKSIAGYVCNNVPDRLPTMNTFKK